MKRNILLSLFCFCAVHGTNKKQQVLDKLFEQSTKHIFDVDDEQFMLKMAHENNQLVYRAVYPFSNIEQSGFYKISTRVTGNITIEVDNVTLDLNGNTVAGRIIVNSSLDNITIKNGTVDATSAADGLKVNAGCSNISLTDLHVRNATTNGIVLDKVSDACIKNCDMSNNDTGLQICNCSNIMVKHCNAIKNTTEGYCLVSSHTCIFIGCHALDTGNPNVATAADICGFVSMDGSGNIFENCMALGTGSDAVTNFNSIVAGFALMGTEACSTIIGCNASNGFSSLNGLTVPYGISLEATIDSTLSLTAVPPIPIPDDSCLDLDWSPDGKYIVAGMRSGDTPRVRVYTFDRSNFNVTQVAIPGTDEIPGGSVTSTRWDPSGSFIAVGSQESTPRVRVYRFNRVNNTLGQVAQANVVPGSVNKVDWSPDGRFVAVVHDTSPYLKVYTFDSVNLTLTQLVAAPNVTPNATALDVQWDPAGKYVAIGDEFSAGGGRVEIYRFDEVNASLIFADNITTGISTFGVRWSPDGKLIASNSSGRGAGIYEFDRDTLVITQLAADTFAFPTGFGSFDWSADGRYTLVGVVSENTAIPSDPLVSAYFYNRTANTYTRVATANIDPVVGASTFEGVKAIRFSPDGCFIAVAAGTENGTTNDPDRIKIYSGISFPSNNVIQDNIVSCNSGGSCPSGIGISGSSVANLIMNNSCFDNPTNPPVTYQNYAYVTNIFDQNFGNAPTALQNLSTNSTDPFQTPDDVNIRLLRSLSKACDIQTQVEHLITLFG